MKQTNIQKFVTAAVVLQGLMLATIWFGQPSTVQARGEVNLPNPSERQLQMIDELRALNAKIEKLNGMLANGEVTVKVAKEEK